MAESPVDTLTRWEDAGAVWRAVHVSDARAIVDLCTCTGEPVERLESDDPELIRFIRARDEG
ncbi:MAG: hypothetical protein QOG63_977 [Thermoleophilaceae bacterium]|jgi:(2Fe-2S) ferredoxin|nr:hypothetical protein [Thermoleophilaceae bacterium]